jgi:hypothetical protein
VRDQVRRVGVERPFFAEGDPRLSSRSRVQVESQASDRSQQKCLLGPRFDFRSSSPHGRHRQGDGERVQPGVDRAGSHFEGQVGARYLLSKLTGAEPCGLPGATIDRTEFQRGSEGRRRAMLEVGRRDCWDEKGCVKKPEELSDSLTRVSLNESNPRANAITELAPG